MCEGIPTGSQTFVGQQKMWERRLLKGQSGMAYGMLLVILMVT
jgi:hypothetical protein